MTNTSTAMDTNLAGPAGTMILDAPPNAAATSAKTTKRKRPNALEREDGELDDEGGAHEGESQGDPRTTNPTSNPRPPHQGAQPTAHLTNEYQPNNPHAQTTRRGLSPLEPTQSRIAYTKATYPRVVKSLDSLLAEIMETTAGAVRANPDKYLALLVYGGGNKIKEENPNLTSDIKDFLRGLTIAGNERIRVVDPPKRDTDKRGSSPSPTSCCFTTDRPNSGPFSALRFDANVRPWFITDIVGRAVSDDPEAIQEGLTTITSALAKDTDFRNHVDACLAKVENSRSIDERVQDTLKSFEIHSMRVTNREKKEITIWQLFADPIANNGLEFKEWLRIITSRRYIIDEIDEMFIRSKNLKPYDPCAFCKSEIHPEEQCPFPLVADWKGPIPREVRAERARAKEEAAARDRTRE
ncbi:hypothetical protein PTI98_010635 [Pleurotus ostreatus]|nr:hypothetical protein PTI98_010635 [Pleurotus ostreatus]